MPTALDATVGGAAANTYSTLAEYKAYWGDRLYNTAALAAADATIEMALLWTGRLLTACFKWNGSAADAVQIMPWPRLGLLTATGFSLPGTVNPIQLKNAQNEWAGILISGGDRTADEPDTKVLGGSQAVTGLTAGPVSIQYEGTKMSTLEEFDAYIRSLSSDFAYLSKSVPDSVRMLLVPGWYKEGQLKRKLIFGAF
jgi:hypothetical protein